MRIVNVFNNKKFKSYLFKKLVTVGGISQMSKYDADRWGDFWCFNPQGIEKAFKEVFGNTHVSVIVYGNSYAATMFLNGVSTEECDKKLDYINENIPLPYL